MPSSTALNFNNTVSKFLRIFCELHCVLNSNDMEPDQTLAKPKLLTIKFTTHQKEIFIFESTFKKNENKTNEK